MAPRLTLGTKMRRNRKDSQSFGWQFARGVLRIGAVVLLLILVWYVTHLKFFTLESIDAIGGETISHEEIETIIERELQGSYFHIIPKRFVYLYPQSRITEVLTQNPRIYDVVITRDSRTHLLVSFKEYVPHALWCADTREDVPCFFVTKSGYAFSEAPSLVGGSFVRHRNEGVDELSVGQVLLPEKLEEIDTFIARAETEEKLRVASVIHKKNGDIEFQIHGGGMIFVSGKKSLTTAFENLTSVLASKEFEHIEPGNFKYIDVRFENKVFVNETLNETTGTATTSSSTLPE